MDSFRIRPIAEADVEAVVIKAGGARAHPDADARDLRGADFVFKDLVIELKALDEEGFDKPARQQKLAALFRPHEPNRPVIVVDRKRLPIEDRRGYDRIVEGPIKNAVKSARGQLAQSRTEFPDAQHSVLFLLNNGYTALDHEALLELAERRARNDSSDIDGVIVAGCYFYSDSFDSYFLWPISYVPVRSQETPAAFETLRRAWNGFADQAMTDLMRTGHGLDAQKGPVVDMAFEVDGVTYVKPAPPMGRASDFFVRGRPRSDSSGLKHCPPVARTYPGLSLAEWTRMYKLLKGDFGLCDNYDEWRDQERQAAQVGTPMLPFVPVPVTAGDWKDWSRSNQTGATLSALTDYANILFDRRLRTLLAAAREQTAHAILPARYVLALTEEIGQDRANDVSHLAIMHERVDGQTQVFPILEDVRMFHEYALTLACAHAIANGIDAVLWRKDQTYGWV